jgi:murein DD-endopeptidase MepM/ murein hydrolase activator NlpD
LQGHPIRRGVIAATVLATLLIPVVGSTADPSQIEKNNEEIEQIQEQLDAVMPEYTTLKGKLEHLRSEITGYSIIANKIRDNVAQVRSDVAEITAQIKATQKDIAAVEERATIQAVALYKSGSTEILETLFSSRTLSELDTKVEMLDLAAEQNSGALIQFGRLKSEIKAQNERLLAKKAELVRELSRQQVIMAKLRGRQAEVAEVYNKVATKVAHLRDKEQGLVDANDAIRAHILSQQNPNPTDLGESSQGFIWPLCCSVTSPYGPRWGSMHTGIDIDGVTGDPIIASKAGTVILAEYYSGYGNAVIIDHGNGYATLYGHMSAFETSNGASVAQGELIGRVGCTGSCTGDHLHFEIRVNGNPVDPMPYLP